MGGWVSVGGGGGGGKSLCFGGLEPGSGKNSSGKTGDRLTNQAPMVAGQLETHFFEVLREVDWGQGEVKNVEKMIPAFFWLENLESFVFFSTLIQKSVSGPDSMGFVWGEVGRAMMHTFQPFLLCWRFWRPR